RPQPIQHSWKRDRFADVFDAGHPSGAAFDAHAETGVRNAAVAAKVEIPFEYFLRQVVVLELLFEVFQRRRAFAAADDLTVAFGCKQVNAERILRIVLLNFEIKTFDRRREVMDENRLAEMIRKICFVRSSEIAAPF